MTPSRRHFLTVALVLWFAVSSSARDPAVRIERDLAFLAPDRAEKLDLYLPAGARAGQRAPAVVWIHGGGWTGGTKAEARAANVCATLAAAGYVAASIDYRLGPGAWPTNLQDCKNAVRFLRVRAADYGIDPDRIAVAGGSAGAHLALLVAFTPGHAAWSPPAPYPGVSDAVRCVISMYAPVNLRTRRESAPDGRPTERPKLGGPLAVFGATSAEDDVYRLASPITHIGPSSPPVLIMQGRADPMVDYLQAEELARVLGGHGVVHQAVFLDGVGHTFDFETWDKRPLPRDLRPTALAFLAAHLGRSDAR